MKHQIIHRLLLLALLTSPTLTAQAQTIRYVSTTGTNTSPNNATSWATASANFNDVVSVSSPGDQVWVRAGLYKPTGTPSRSQSFVLKNGVAIYGGFQGGESTLGERVLPTLTNPSSTTLSGEIGDLNTVADNVYHVVVGASDATATTIFDGFVIRGGNANGAAYPDLVGGGLYNRGGGSGKVGNPTVRNCLFISNSAVYGGAVLNEGNSGGISNPVFTNCIFRNNSATDSGGGLYNFGNAGTSSPTLTNCAFQNNTALNGGAMINDGASSGTSNPTLTNCTFQGNTGSTVGGALYNYAPAPGTSNATLTNCILFGNGGANTISNNNGSASARYSLFEPTVTGYTSVTGNVTTSTLPFASTTDVRLVLGSPAINTGDPATTPATVGTTDLAGNKRFLGRIDMGAVEFCTVVTRLYVNFNATGNNTGLSWADAFNDLQSALTYPCSQSLAEIWVATGVYKPTSTTARTASFVMLPGVALYGNFAGNETAVDQRTRRNLVTDQPRTVLSGDIGTANNTADNSFHVVSSLTTGTPTAALLDGVVITAGNASGSNFPDNAGGGMLNQRSSPTVQNCVFINNLAVLGGAIYNNGSSSGRDSSPTMSYCVFQTNRATSSGGAIYNNGTGSGNSSPTLVNCAFLGNTVSGGSGGAVYNDGSSSGSSNPRLTNCSFQGNTAANGGAVAGSGNSNALLANSVLFGNGGASTFFNFSPATISLRYSLVEPTATGYTNGPGNITTTANPFVSTTSIDIPAASLAVNTADPTTTSATVGEFDVAVKPRFVGCRYDMGAVEFQYTFSPPSRVYVAASQTATNGGDGLTWATAYKDLQNATAYGCPVSEIWVATGVYKPATTDRTVSFAMRPNTAIYGGFGGNETALNQRPVINPVSGNPSSSTLSGDIGTMGNTADNSYHVISNPAGLTNTAILDGFVITGGNGDDIGILGGGIFNNGEGSGNVCSPTIRNCVFAANRADIGGAICNYGIGGGNSSPTISNCLFQSNTGTRRGGAIFNYGDGGTSSPTLANCAFLGNTGGALRNDGFSGGVSSPRLTNCSFQGNTNGFAPGGVLYNSVGSRVALTNCVLFGNGGVGTFFNESGATITMRYSLVETTVTGYTSGPGNLNTTTSPFATTASIALTGSALALNTGDPATTSATIGSTDLAGNARFVGCRIDMGAVEYQVVSSIARVYVSASQTALNGGDGLTWATAYKDLQSALTGCTTAEIWVATGTYRPTIGTDRAISFAMRPGTAIYGGFLGNETSLALRPAINVTTPSGTTLSGDIGTIGSNTDNSYHVVNNVVGLTETAVLDGFVITGGNANGSAPDNAGGGMYNNGAGSGNASSPGIRNCFFVGNQATFGGAIFNGGFQNGISSPAITNTVFQSNTAFNGGGAVYNAGYNSGNSSPTLINCAFLRNGATNGGSIYNDATGGSSSPALINCSFQGNTATNGGGLYNFADFSSNSSNPTLTNCVVFGNGAAGNGGASTFFNNSPATTTLRYSLTEPTVTGYVSGPGNLTATATPFVSTTSVVLSATALAINTGDPTTTTAIAGVTDLAGGARFAYGRIDMGAYEVPCGVLAITRLYVRAGVTGINTGLNWTDAFSDLQAALNYDCSQNLTEIWVASGTYKPTPGTSRTISFAMRNGLAIYGGFAGSETTLSQRALTNPGSGQPSSSTLSGDIGTVGNRTDNSYHVISNPAGLTTTAILDGFVIAGGNADNGSFPDGVGGGMFNNGEYAGNRCSPLIRNCTFLGNQATFGGAIYNDGAADGNSAPVLLNCLFQNNSAFTYGGAIYNDGGSGSSIPLLTNCSFQSNSAATGGGGIYNYGSNGISSPVLTNCVMFGNGGANTISNSFATTTARYSLFDASVTGYTSGPGNLTTTISPFASTATTRLRPGSPAINTGDPATTTATVGITDLAGLPRFAGGRIDMGAVEVQDEMFTIATGNWNNPAIWNVGRIPQVGDRARLKHAVTLPTSYVGFVTTLVYDPAGRLIYGAGGQLQFGQ